MKHTREQPLEVRDVMSTILTTLMRNDTLVTAEDVMRLGRVRHMPVLDEDGELVGIVSQRDLFHNALLKALGYGSHAAHRAREMTLVKEAMSTELVTTTPTTSLCEAATVMLERKIGCLPVLDGDALVGIITESDFVRLAVKD
jgi:CBS domain-containing protein